MPTNQFVAKVTVNFPGEPSRYNLMRWFNLQNCGKETIPFEEKVSESHKKNVSNLIRSRIYNFVFEITKSGEWKFVGRKAD